MMTRRLTITRIIQVIIIVIHIVPAYGQKDTKQDAGTEKPPIAKQIENLQQEKEAIQQKEQLQPLIQDISQRIDTVQQDLQDAQGETQTFFQLKLSVLTKWYQHVNELAQSRNRMANILDEHIQVLQSKKEEQSKPYEHKEQRPGTAPGYETLREYAQKIHNTKQELQSLENNKTNLVGERNRRQRALEEIQQEYDQKQKQRAAINRKPETAAQVVDETLQTLRVTQQAEIIDLQLEQLQYKKKLAQAKIEEDRLNIDLTETKINQSKKSLKRLKDEYDEITRTLYIDPEYIEREKNRLEKQRQEVSAQQEKLNERWRSLSARENEIQKTIDELIDTYNISKEEVEVYREWHKQPETAEEWQLLAEFGEATAERQYIQAQRQRVDGQINQELIKLRHEELNFDILQTWYQLRQSKQSLTSIRELEQEIRKYEGEKTQLEVERNTLQDQRNNAINMLGKLNARLDTLKELKKKISGQDAPQFDDSQAVTTISNKLQKAEADVRKQIDVTAKLVEIYSTSMATIESSIARIEDIISQLRSRSFWMRSDQSISWQNLQNFINNLDSFITELRTKTLYNITQIDIWYYTQTITATMYNPYELLLIVMQILLLILAYIALRRYLPIVANTLVQYESNFSIINILSGLLATILRFTRHHLTSMYAWIIIFSMVAYGLVASLQFAIVFYLLSIPYGIYIAYSFFEYLIRVNRERGYIFIGQDYQNRFLWIVPSLTYATVAITLFRQAFLLSGYYDYQILLALNFILLQISLICLISREQVLSLISGDTPMWNWVEEHVSQYYYILLLALITIIVMSNPFVGLGYQVLYYFTRTIVTLMLIPIFSWLHDHIKRATSDLFFYYSEGEVIKERFSGGKFWYGLFVIASFFALTLCGFIITAYIWGHTITLEAITQWFDTALYTADYDAYGNPINVTIYSLLKVLLFGVSGIGITYIINRFVLQRIFDPLLVGAGVQNTIVTLTRYAIIILAFLFGFQSAGLEALGWKIILLITGLAYIMKEPLGDVVSYFIILVQRPIKVGDYISMDLTAGADPNISGIVRQINPRSTIIRHKNSTSFVVPNSHIITKSVKNWHYTRTFTAFDDIWLTVPYHTDPDQVRDLIFHVLEENVNVLRNPRPIVRLERFGENGFTFRVRGFITADKILDLYEISSQVRLAIVRKLREEGMSIAEPIRVLKSSEHLREHIDSSADVDNAPQEQQEE